MAVYWDSNNRDATLVATMNALTPDTGNWHEAHVYSLLTTAYGRLQSLNARRQNMPPIFQPSYNEPMARIREALASLEARMFK